MKSIFLFDPTDAVFLLLDHQSGLSLGHSSITTTMRYAHFAPSHACGPSWKLNGPSKGTGCGEKRATSASTDETIKTSVPATLLDSMPGAGIEPARPFRGSGF